MNKKHIFYAIVFIALLFPVNAVLSGIYKSEGIWSLFKIFNHSEWFQVMNNVTGGENIPGFIPELIMSIFVIVMQILRYCVPTFFLTDFLLRLAYFFLSAYGIELYPDKELYDSSKRTVDISGTDLHPPQS